MPKFPEFDLSGIGFDVHLWHLEWGDVHVSVGMPSYPPGVCDNAEVDAAVRVFAESLLGPIGGEKILGISRIQTAAETWRPPEPEPTP
ncbi:hypothetical protein ACFUGD_01715 [Streptomyces sp. NPDC057217]|uniref:hypothetical protein n=1 Tax=Streptomyces sp. NPDC057217 TaxID=3346054 RepID=UPI0036451CC0